MISSVIIILLLGEYPASVTVSSSGAAGKKYPRRMGRYLLTDKLHNGHPLYRHTQNSNEIYCSSKYILYYIC